MKVTRLTAREATSATAIQGAIDALSDVGGRVVLPEMDLVLDRGLQLRSNVELVGHGEHTVLQKAPAQVKGLEGGKEKALDQSEDEKCVALSGRTGERRAQASSNIEAQKNRPQGADAQGCASVSSQGLEAGGKDLP